MQQVTSPSVQSLPKIGYLVSNEEKKEKFYKNESHLYKQTPIISGLKADAHQLYNAVFTYFPKGFAGSKNSDFYEYLALGKVPNLIGSIMLIGTYGFANKLFNPADAAAASKGMKQMGAGVVLYGLGKWAYQRLARTAINASTGINLDERYIKKIDELPEIGQDKGLVRIQYPEVFGSVQFWRNDLKAKDGEINHNNVYYHDDKIVKKAGYTGKLNASNQTADEKIRKVNVRTKALENIGKYIIAATGVAYGSQEAFTKIKFKHPKTILTALKDGAVQLWEGTKRNNITKHYGKALVIASGVMTFLTWLIPTATFKHKADNLKTKVDTNKDYEVC